MPKPARTADARTWKHSAKNGVWAASGGVTLGKFLDVGLQAKELLDIGESVDWEWIWKAIMNLPDWAFIGGMVVLGWALIAFAITFVDRWGRSYP